MNFPVYTWIIKTKAIVPATPNSSLRVLGGVPRMIVLCNQHDLYLCRIVSAEKKLFYRCHLMSSRFGSIAKERAAIQSTREGLAAFRKLAPNADSGKITTELFSKLADIKIELGKAQTNRQKVRDNLQRIKDVQKAI